MRNKLLEELAVIQSVKTLPFILSKLVQVMVMLVETPTILLEVFVSLSLPMQMHLERGHHGCYLPNPFKLTKCDNSSILNDKGQLKFRPVFTEPENLSHPTIKPVLRQLIPIHIYIPSSPL